MFYSAISSAVQRILANVRSQTNVLTDFPIPLINLQARVPDYDLLPVNQVNQTLLLLRDILESQNDGTLSVVTQKREIYNKVSRVSGTCIFPLFYIADFHAHSRPVDAIHSTCVQQPGQPFGRGGVHVELFECHPFPDHPLPIHGQQTGNDQGPN
jgi:hypothetical protein